MLEAQIVQRDSIASGTTFAVQSLDHKNLAVVGDLRGRVARYQKSKIPMSTVTYNVHTHGLKYVDI